MRQGVQPSRAWRDDHEAASRALEVGDAVGCRDRAVRMLRLARQVGDVEAQAHASLLLARSQWVSSLPGNALLWSESAGRLAQGVGLQPVMAAALSVQSCAASAMGMSDVAVDRARQSLSELSGTLREEAVAANYLATALCWGGRFEEARRAFDMCLEVAGECPERVLSFQPLVNRCLGALLELGMDAGTVDPGRSVDVASVLDRLQMDLDTCDDMLQHGQISTVNAGMERIMELCFLSLRGQWMLLRTQWDAADLCLQHCRDLGQRFPRQHWVRLFVHWLAFEYAHRRGELRSAAVSAQAMEQAASRGGHEAFRVFARRLRVDGPSALN